MLALQPYSGYSLARAYLDDAKPVVLVLASLFHLPQKGLVVAVLVDIPPVHVVPVAEHEYIRPLYSFSAVHAYGHWRTHTRGRVFHQRRRVGGVVLKARN